MLAPVAFREATGSQRTVRTQGFGSCADGRPEIHDRLGVHVDLRIGRALIGQLPQTLGYRALGRIAMNSEKARQHSFDVAIEDWESLPTAQRQNGPCGGAPDAREARNAFEGRRKLAAELVTHTHRSTMKVSAPRVVTQARP